MIALMMKDGTRIYSKEWGAGQPVVFTRGWPLSSDSWEPQMLFLTSMGHRCTAHDRRGHGSSTQPWNGNDMDTYADDLSGLPEHPRSWGRVRSLGRRTFPPKRDERNCYE